MGRTGHAALAAALSALLVCAGCSDSARPTDPGGTRMRFDIGASAGFFDAPFPLPSRALQGGGLRVDDFPNPRHNILVDRILVALSRPDVGFGTTAAIYLPFDGALDDGALPDAAASVADDSPIFLVDVDDSSPARGERVPLMVRFKREAETFSPKNLLVLLPRPGVALRAGTRYAAVVSAALRDAEGKSLRRPALLDRLLGGGETRDLPTALVEAFAALAAALGDDVEMVRAATVFRTGDPFAATEKLHSWVAAQPLSLDGRLAALREHDGFCVITGSVRVPLVQDGARPFKERGGAIALDQGGEPLTQRAEQIRFAVTLPKRTMPRDGFPLLFYSAGQGGAYTQVVDRGTFAEQDAGKLGSGPARYLAASGIAAISIEAPLVGPRHPSGDVTGLDFFNVTNPLALRDNVRQAALDFSTLIAAARALSIPPALCSEASTGSGGAFRFDPERFYFHGHSTGATVGALVLALEPDLRAGVLSGFGGSWLYNLTIKKQPLDFAKVVPLLLGYNSADAADLFDPVLNLAQTLWEPAEPINWARRWAIDPRAGGRPRHLLIIEGVVDGYFPPPSVNAAAIAARAEPLLPTVEPTLLDDLTLVGGRGQSAPAGKNLDTQTKPVTSLVAQHRAPQGVDGHYVPFELPAAKRQYRCFFSSDGERVPAGDTSDALAPCAP